MSFWYHCFDQNSNKRISALKFFEASWGLPGSFLGLPRDFVSNIINKEANRKPQGSYKNFQGRNPYNIFVGFLVENMTPKGLFKINWPIIWEKRIKTSDIKIRFQTYNGEPSKPNECVYHPGVPIFHEGLKFWSCCQRKTTDFQSFLDQKGCDFGKCKWKKDSVSCFH